MKEGGYLILKIEQNSMLCHKCLLNVLKTLAVMKGIEFMSIDLDNKSIQLNYDQSIYSEAQIRQIVNTTIVTGKIPTELLTEEKVL